MLTDQKGAVEAVVEAVEPSTDAGQEVNESGVWTESPVEPDPIAHIEDSDLGQEYEKLEMTLPSCEDIRTFLATIFGAKEMTQAEFLRRYNINSTSYRRFMKLEGKDNGVQNGTYWAAVRLHLSRTLNKSTEVEEAPVSVGSKRKAEKAADAQETDAPAVSTTAKSTPNKRSTKPKSSYEEYAVTGEEETPVVYDDCDEIRRKISEFYLSSPVSKNEFCRLIACNTNAVNRFLHGSGPLTGAGSKVYPSAYIFFERLRIAHDEPKTQHRLDNETNKPEGFDLKNPPTHVWVFNGSPEKEATEQEL